MNEKTVILYDLKQKTNNQRTRILQKLYGYRDKSNYHYSYERKGLLDKVNFEKSKKTILQLRDKNDLAKVTEILKKLEVDFEVAKIR